MIPLVSYKRSSLFDSAKNGEMMGYETKRRRFILNLYLESLRVKPRDGGRTLHRLQVRDAEPGSIKAAYNSNKRRSQIFLVLALFFSTEEDSMGFSLKENPD